MTSSCYEGQIANAEPSFGLNLSGAVAQPLRCNRRLHVQVTGARTLAKPGWSRRLTVVPKMLLQKERSEDRPSITLDAGEGAMVLIQLLLPTKGGTRADGLTPLTETRRELADRFNGLTAYLRSPAKGLCSRWPHGTGRRRHGGNRHRVVRPSMVARLCRHASGPL